MAVLLSETKGDSLESALTVCETEQNNCATPLRAGQHDALFVEIIAQLRFVQRGWTSIGKRRHKAPPLLCLFLSTKQAQWTGEMRGEEAPLQRTTMKKFFGARKQKQRTAKVLRSSAKRKFHVVGLPFLGTRTGNACAFRPFLKLTMIVNPFPLHRVHIRIVRVLDAENSVYAVTAADAAFRAVQGVWSAVAAIAILRICRCHLR